MPHGKIESERFFDKRRAIDHLFSILKYSGHYPFENESKPRVLYLFGFSILYFTLLSTETYYLWSVFGDVDKMSDALFLYITHLGIFYKSCNLLLRHQTMRKLIEDLSTESADKINKSRQQKIKDKEMSNFGTVIYVFVGVILLAWLLAMASPSVQPGITLPLGAKYPFDAPEPGWYQLAYLEQAAFILTVAMVTLSLDFVLVFLMQQMCLQLDFLRDEFLHVNEDAEIVAREVQHEDVDTARQRLLAKAIVHHQDLIR